MVFCLENKFINMFIFWEKEISLYLHFVSLEAGVYLCTASHTHFISLFAIFLVLFGEVFTRVPLIFVKNVHQMIFQRTQLVTERRLKRNARKILFDEELGRESLKYGLKSFSAWQLLDIQVTIAKKWMPYGSKYRTALDLPCYQLGYKLKLI